MPDADLKAVNEATAWGAKQSEEMDLTKEDAADDLLLNEIVWAFGARPEISDAAARSRRVRVPAFSRTTNRTMMAIERQRDVVFDLTEQ